MARLKEEVRARLLRIKSFRLKVFLAFFTYGCFHYLVGCLLCYSEHPELPWFETGIYMRSPYGFWMAGGSIVFAFGYLIFGKDE